MPGTGIGYLALQQRLTVATWDIGLAGAERTVERAEEAGSPLLPFVADVMDGAAVQSVMQTTAGQLGTPKPLITDG